MTAQSCATCAFTPLRIKRPESHAISEQISEIGDLLHAFACIRPGFVLLVATAIKTHFSLLFTGLAKIKFCLFSLFC